MPVRSIAVFSVKGGVGKSALAVNLAYASAVTSARRTLLWDLDAQGAATFMMRLKPRGSHSARKGIAEGELDQLIQSSEFAGLDVLAADRSLRHLEAQLLDDKAKRLKKLLRTFDADYDRVVLDCPPGLTELADQIFRAVDLLVVPMLPSALSMRAFAQLQDHLGREHKQGPKLLPVFSMVDRRKTLHREALAEHPERLVIPYAAAVETMGQSRMPLLASQPRSPAAKAFAAVWTEAERSLLKG
ncbi:MAG: ParA family protein [Polymorphobacter sp.]|uniref:ParA family protein n=1 Tax=Polymorphobacter sp. TaxID=1909290 RepID=UPI003A8BE9F0